MPTTAAAPQSRGVGLCRKMVDSQSEDNDKLPWMKHYAPTPALFQGANQPKVQTQRVKDPQ